MKKIFLFFLLTGIFCIINAQIYSVKQIDSLMAVTDSLINSHPQEAIPAYNKIHNIAAKTGYQKIKIKSLNQIAFCYYVLGNNEQAIKYAKIAEKQALEVKDYLGLCNALRFSAITYPKLGFYKEGEEMIDKAFSIVNKINDPNDFYETKGSLYQAKAAIIINKDNSSKSRKLFEYHKKALDEFIKIPDIKRQNEALITGYANLGVEYSNKKEFDSAFHYINASLELSRKSKNLRGEYLALCYLGYTSGQQKNCRKAVDYFEAAIPIIKNSKSPYMLSITYENLSECYRILKDEKKEQEYLIKYKKINDSLAKSEKEAIKIPLQEIVKEKEENFKSAKNNLYLIIIFILLLTSAAVFLVLRYLKNYRREKSEKQQKEMVIEEKKSELTKLEQKINYAFEEVLQLAKTDDSSFLTRFSEVYPEFIEKLNNKYPSLTTGQLKFCALLKLNFSTKEIAYYNHISHRSVEMKKSRLRKQLNIPSSEDLNKWMIRF